MRQERKRSRRVLRAPRLTMSGRSQLAYVSAGLTLGLGLLALFNPGLVLGIVGLTVSEARGYGEGRALYGAFFATMGGYMLWALTTRPRNRRVLRFVGFLWLASGLGRLLSLIIDGPFAIGSILLLVFDVIVAAGALVGAGEPDSKRPVTEAEATEDDPLRALRS